MLILVPLINRSGVNGDGSIRSSDRDSYWTNGGSIEVAPKAFGFNSITETDFKVSPVGASALKLGHRRGQRIREGCSSDNRLLSISASIAYLTG